MIEVLMTQSFVKQIMRLHKLNDINWFIQIVFKNRMSQTELYKSNDISNCIIQILMIEISMKEILMVQIFVTHILNYTNHEIIQET